MTETLSWASLHDKSVLAAVLSDIRIDHIRGGIYKFRLGSAGYGGHFMQIIVNHLDFDLSQRESVSLYLTGDEPIKIDLWRLNDQHRLTEEKAFLDKVSSRLDPASIRGLGLLLITLSETPHHSVNSWELKSALNAVGQSLTGSVDLTI